MFAQEPGTEKSGMTTLAELTAPPIELDALDIESIMEERLAARGLWPNVDLFSGVVFHALDVPIDFFTPLFAASRVAGWAVNLKEQLESGNRLFRPTQIWVGEKPRALGR